MASFLSIEMHLPLDSVERYYQLDNYAYYQTNRLLDVMAETVEETLGLKRLVDFDMFYSIVDFNVTTDRRERAYDMSGRQAISLVFRNNQSVNYNSKEFLASIMSLKLKFDGAIMFP